MAVVEHGGDTVKSETIEFELFEPIAAVAEQEVDYFVFAIVEAEAVPLVVVATITGIEILVGVSAEVSKSFVFVFHCVAVNEIHNHGYAHVVGFVDELF